MVLPKDVYDPAVAVKRAPDDAEAAIERAPLPVLATRLSRWEDMHWSKARTGGSSIPPTMTLWTERRRPSWTRWNGGSRGAWRGRNGRPRGDRGGEDTRNRARAEAETARNEPYKAGGDPHAPNAAPVAGERVIRRARPREHTPCPDRPSRIRAAAGAVPA